MKNLRWNEITQDQYNHTELSRSICANMNYCFYVLEENVDGNWVRINKHSVPKINLYKLNEEN